MLEVCPFFIQIIVLTWNLANAKIEANGVKIKIASVLFGVVTSSFPGVHLFSFRNSYIPLMSRLRSLGLHNLIVCVRLSLHSILELSRE